MIEWLWAALLILAASHRLTRALALLLACKWAVNYAAFSLVSQTSPVLIDVAAGAVVVVWASHVRARWADWVLAAAVVTPLVHAWYWLQHLSGTASPLAYYWLILGLFTAQVSALAWPAARDHARSLVHRLHVRDRGGVAGLAGERRAPRIDRHPA